MDMDDHSMEMGFLPASGLQLYTSSILVNELKKPKNMSFEHKPHPYTIAQNKNSKMTRPVQVATWSLRKATWSFTAGKVGLASRTWKELCLWLLTLLTIATKW